jgi:hypothetical protein
MDGFIVIVEIAQAVGIFMVYFCLLDIYKTLKKG